VRAVLEHDAPEVFGQISADVKDLVDGLVSVGDPIVPSILSGVQLAAEGDIGTRSWEGASVLCEALGRIDTPIARDALLSILREDSEIPEFHERVRGTAAQQLGRSEDSSLVPELLACLPAQRYPSTVRAIEIAVEGLGGSAPETPETIIRAAMGMSGDAAVAYLRGFETQIASWPVDRRGGYYYWLGTKTEEIAGWDEAAPFYAASLRENPDGDSATWRFFPVDERSAEVAEQLAREYPLRATGAKG